MRNTFHCISRQMSNVKLLISKMFASALRTGPRRLLRQISLLTPSGLIIFGGVLAHPYFDPKDMIWHLRSRDSSVDMATGYRLDGRGVPVRVPVGSRFFCTSFRPILGPIQPPIQWVPVALSPRREADHSPPSSAEVKKTCIYTSTPP
jgi:hypothetical protein